MIHASWMQHVQIGVTLLESVKLDTKDSVKLESEISQFGYINEPAPGREPAMTSLKSRFSENEKEATVEKPSEFGCSGGKPSCKKRKKYNLHLLTMLHQRRICKKMNICLKSV